MVKINNKLELAKITTICFFILLLTSFKAYTATNLVNFQKDINLNIVFPTADSFKKIDNNNSALRIYTDSNPVGYIIINTDFNNAIGYSGRPIHIAIGIDNKGIIQGVQLLKHFEPIVLIGIPEQQIIDTFKRYDKFNVVRSWLDNKFAKRKIDAISGATVTDRVIDDSVIRAVLKFSKNIGILTSSSSAKIQQSLNQNYVPKEKNWQDLLNDNSVSQLNLKIIDVSNKFKAMNEHTAAANVESENPNDRFIDLYIALVSIEEIGFNLLGEAEYKNLANKLGKDQHAIVIIGNGLFSFRGSGFVRGGVFDRFTLEQDGEVYRFRDSQYKRLGKIKAKGAPKFREIGVFTMPKNAKFDPTKSWQLNLLINRVTSVTSKSFYNQIINYQLPERFIVKVKRATNVNNFDDTNSADKSLIKSIWEDKYDQIIILFIALIILTIIFFMQDTLILYPRAYTVLRVIFLLFTTIWIGFVVNAQLSIVNILTFINVLLDEFQWQFFLRDPLIFILWCSVAAILILWGRGAYCGWLCPFGALQEIINRIAKKLNIPQIKMPWGLHERLWAFKYLIFLFLLGVSLYSLDEAEKLSEVEPFKTVIILNFQHYWPFVVYAIALLVIGIFIERFFCRYLCPLGAALAIPAKIGLFNWLKRYPKDCGSPCQICAKECMVDAIHPEGNISANECLYCMHCQKLYYNENKCPAMARKRKRAIRQAEWEERKRSNLITKGEIS